MFVSGIVAGVCIGTAAGGGFTATGAGGVIGAAVIVGAGGMIATGGGTGAGVGVAAAAFAVECAGSTNDAVASMIESASPRATTAVTRPTKMPIATRAAAHETVGRPMRTR